MSKTTTIFMQQEDVKGVIQRIKDIKPKKIIVIIPNPKCSSCPMKHWDIF